MKKRPTVELSDCILCYICVEVYPEVFVLTDSGYIDIKELEKYPEETVDEAIKNCPAQCIAWEHGS